MSRSEEVRTTLARLARGGPAATLALVALAVLPGCHVEMPFARQLFFEAEAPALPSAADCERCHLEVHREWSDSLHARAWTSEAYQRASLGGRAAECVSCHAPAPIDPEVPVRARAERREEGVTCVSCHLSTDPDAERLTMRGPVTRSSPVEVHPLFEADPFYRSSALCGRCHEGAYAEWQASPPPPAGEERETCQACHMPEVERTVESYHPEHPYSAVFVALESKQTLRRHLFAVPEDAEEHLGLSVRPRDRADSRVLEVRVDNRLPHALPTGRFGRREVRVVAEWPGGRSEALLVRALGEAVAAGASRRVEVPLPPGVEPADVAVRLERWDHRTGDFVTLVTLDGPTHP